MQWRGRRARRCRYCGRLETVKNGRRLLIQVGLDGKVKRRVQSYQCLGCGRYFSIPRERKGKYSWGFKVHVERMHLEERMSYRVMTGTQTGALPNLQPTGKAFMVRGCSIAQLKDGKLLRTEDYWDRADFLRQLGVIWSDFTKSVGECPAPFRGMAA